MTANQCQLTEYKNFIKAGVKTSWTANIFGRACQCFEGKKQLQRLKASKLVIIGAEVGHSEIAPKPSG